MIAYNNKTEETKARLRALNIKLRASVWSRYTVGSGEELSMQLGSIRSTPIAKLNTKLNTACNQFAISFPPTTTFHQLYVKSDALNLCPFEKPTQSKFQNNDYLFFYLNHPLLIKLLGLAFHFYLGYKSIKIWGNMNKTINTY